MPLTDVNTHALSRRRRRPTLTRLVDDLALLDGSGVWDVLHMSTSQPDEMTCSADTTDAPEDHDHGHHHIDVDNEAGVGPGSRLATHEETEIEHAKNMNGRGLRSRSRGDGVAPINGYASPVSPPSGGNPPGKTLTPVVALLA